MREQVIEQEIQQKGLTAPRITPADLEANIKTECYFTADAPFRAQHLMEIAGDIPDPALNLLTFCVLVLKNGFTVTGESACASPENFNAEIGARIARDNARDKVWALEGYLLRERLANQPKPKIYVCGVDCHRGDDNCNGYCNGKAPHAKPIAS